MRRRRRFSLAVVIAAMLCAAVAGFWARSYFAQDGVLIRPGTSLLTLHAFQARGSFALVGTRGVDYKLTRLGGRVGRNVSAPLIELYDYWGTRSPVVHVAGFAVQCTGSGVGILLPHWFAQVSTIALLAIAVVRARRRSEARGKNLCPVCGYDLCATPERCPECGTPVAPMAASFSLPARAPAPISAAAQSPLP